jgi:hypothetical protein
MNQIAEREREREREKDRMKATFLLIKKDSQYNEQKYLPIDIAISEMLCS